MAATGAASSSSISVTVRVRPFTIREAAQLSKCDDGPLFLGDGSLAGVATPKLTQKGLRSVVKVVDDRCLVFDPPEENPIQRFSKSVLPPGKKTKDQTFGFDRVFDENTSQADVYEATTKNLLDSVLDGYNATVFAYGATGCGKTHTITGTAQQPGIIFLTMQELFERISDVQDDKVTEISLSYLEIYNETIRDLLVPSGIVGSKGGLMLREDANQAVSVAGLSSHHPQNVQEVMDMIVRGNELRTMSPTEANATSSRSHAVLQINVSQKDRNADINEPHTMATLSIIDLAGSERASATKNRGERLMEGANINRSLLALGSCINALCDPRKRNHVPYRDSKLTRLLKFSLGGNCRTVMIVCVSPSSAHFDETQNTLRYANRAKNIQTKVTRNVYNVNRHVKDFVKKIDEQMTLINELKQQQKDYENVAFAKFRKQNEKREVVIKEGIARLRAAYDHSQAERKDRVNNTKKLRQIEKRIALITSWTLAFNHVCELREDEDPPQNLLSMKKTAQGILAELEQSRHHYHQRLAKINWQRQIDTALQTGLKQLEEMETAEQSESETLTREAELLKSDAERELHLAVLEQEKGTDAAVPQVLLQAHFETVAIINQILAMEEPEAIAAAKTMLHKIVSSCSDATSHVIRPDGTLPIVEAQPPTKSGTPKRKRGAKLLGPSPMKPRLDPVPESGVAATPKFSSPMKFKVGSAKKTRITPKKKSPVKRSIRWRDDTEGCTLQDYSQTPQRGEESTPDTGSSEAPHLPVISSIISEANAEAESSSPIEPPPQISFDVKPKADRFQAGFLSRKSNNSPQAPTAPSEAKVSPNPSPLQEMTNNRAFGRVSSSGFAKLDGNVTGQDENTGQHSSSDSETNLKTGKEDARNIRRAVRQSLSRSSSVRDSTSRTHRRRSPSQSSNTASPSSDIGMFSTSHARRMVKGDKETETRNGSILSPRTTPVQKTSHLASSRRMTMSVGDENPRLQRSASRNTGSRPSSIVAAGSVGGNRGSMAAPSVKSVWR